MNKTNTKKTVKSGKGPLNSPIRQFIFSFIILIISGTGLLMLPWSTVNGISLIDALFTSTSAVCVTGLIVLDTAKDFTFAGQCIILMLIQLGGFGIMTFSIGIFSMLGGDLSIKWHFTFESLYDGINIIPASGILKKILLYTLVIESTTAILLFTQFVQFYSISEALRHSIFHAVSAFCNAGFSTFSDSLVSLQGNSIVILAVSLSVILGGIGFIVLTEMSEIKTRPGINFFSRFSLHTKLVLSVTALLITAGTVLFFTLEYNYVMDGMGLGDKILVSFFQSVTCRTAGFNTVDIGSLRESTLAMMMVLMFIGGSPGSIAGGIKTTTIAVISGMLITMFRGERQIKFFKRAISPEILNKSMTLFVLSFILIYISVFMLLSLHSFDSKFTFQQVVFEVVSAFATVGLTTGITTGFSWDGRLIMTLIMFIGRIGPFALITAITANRKTTRYKIADENIMIG